MVRTGERGTQGNERNDSKEGPETALRPIRIQISFGRKTCLFGGKNESTALMDNAGEGTPGTGLWEGKSEQKEPFSCLHLCSLANKVLASCWDR